MTSENLSFINGFNPNFSPNVGHPTHEQKAAEAKRTASTSTIHTLQERAEHNLGIKRKPFRLG